MRQRTRNHIIDTVQYDYGAYYIKEIKQIRIDLGACITVDQGPIKPNMKRHLTITIDLTI